MSFWNTSEGTKATGEVQENNDFAPLPKGDYICMLEEAKNNEYEGKRKISLKVRVVGDGFGKNRVIFPNIKCWEEDKTKRDRAIQLLFKIFGVCKAKLPKDEPTDEDLMQLCDKPMVLKLAPWEMELGGELKKGNWIVNAEAVGAKAGAATTKKPVAKAEPAFADGDDQDIPF